MVFDLVANVVVFLDEHLAFFDLGRLGVGDPLHVVVAHLALEHALRITDATQAKMPDVMARRSHRSSVPGPFYLALAQVGVRDERNS